MKKLTYQFFTPLFRHFKYFINFMHIDSDVRRLAIGHFNLRRIRVLTN